MRQVDITPAQSKELFSNFMAAHGYQQGTFLDSGLDYFANDELAVLFVNKPVSENNLRTQLRNARAWPQTFTPVFIKDAKTYFRSAAFSDELKRDTRFQKSIAHYPQEDKKKMVYFKPAERAARQLQGAVNYYQPETDRLEEKLLAYRFNDVLQKPTSNHAFARETYSRKVFLPVKEHVIF